MKEDRSYLGFFCINWKSDLEFWSDVPVMFECRLHRWWAVRTIRYGIPKRRIRVVTGDFAGTGTVMLRWERGFRQQNVHSNAS